QDVFATLVEKMPTFEHDLSRSFRAWLRTVTHNRWRDHCRRKAAALRGGNEAGLEEIAVPDATQAIFEAEYHQHVLRQALGVTPVELEAPPSKACVGLVPEGKPAAVIAAELNVTPVAVYSAKARVLRRLRQEFDGLLE